MSVRRAEAELLWFKRNRENTGTMRENTGTGHTAGDHVLITAILSAIFIVVLVYLLVLGQPFRFRCLERAGSMVRRKQDFCPVFSAPSDTTPEATTLSQTAQRREARTTTCSTTSDRLGRAGALNPIDRCYSAWKNLRSETHWIAVFVWLLSVLTPQYNVPSCTQLAFLLVNQRAKEEMKCLLRAQATDGVALTNDGSTSCATQAIARHTANFLNREWARCGNSLLQWETHSGELGRCFPGGAKRFEL